MRFVEPAGAFKILGGHLVLHLGQFIALLVISKHPQLITSHKCKQPDVADLVTVLIVSHGVSAGLSIILEFATFMRFFSIQSIMELLRIPFYFYVIIYTSYYGLKIPQEHSCIEELHFPLD